MRVKIDVKIKIIFWFKGEIEMKNCFKKKKIKRMKIKLVKIIYYKFGLKDEVENKLNFYKSAKRKIRN